MASVSICCFGDNGGKPPSIDLFSRLPCQAYTTLLLPSEVIKWIQVTKPDTCFARQKLSIYQRKSRLGLKTSFDIMESHIGTRKEQGIEIQFRNRSLQNDCFLILPLIFNSSKVTPPPTGKRLLGKDQPKLIQQFQSKQKMALQIIPR